MVNIATPVYFGGFSRPALEAFAPQLRALGLEPRQGIVSGGRHRTRHWAIRPTSSPAP